MSGFFVLEGHGRASPIHYRDQTSKQSKTVKNIKNKNSNDSQVKQQPKQTQSAEEQPDYVKINTEKRIKEEKVSLKTDEAQVKQDNKNQVKSKLNRPEYFGDSLS